VRPANGAPNALRSPTFEWSNVGGASNYILQLYVDEPNNPVGNRRYEIIDSGGATSAFSIPDNDPLRADRQYYWDVTPLNSVGSGPVSEKWTFHTRVAGAAAVVSGIERALDTPLAFTIVDDTIAVHQSRPPTRNGPRHHLAHQDAILANNQNDRDALNDQGKTEKLVNRVLPPEAAIDKQALDHAFSEFDLFDLDFYGVDGTTVSTRQL
jgi:hypothetical protein